MDFTNLTRYLDGLTGVGVPGCDLIVYKDHREIYRHFAGMRDREAGVKMDGSEVYWIYSATKVHTCAAALQLIERGLIDLDDPVAKYLPAYSHMSVIENGRVRAAATVMTVRHLFAMQGGLTYDIHSPSIEKAKLYSGMKANTRTLVDAIAEEPLTFDPGAHYQYSLCHDVLGAIIEVVSGEKLSDYMRKHIWDALGLKDTGFTLTEDKKSRFAKQYTYDADTQTSHPFEDGDENCYQLTPNYESGGAGLLSSVNDYILLSDALACGGAGATGEHIMKPETVDLMRTNQQSGACMDDFSNNFRRRGYGYGLGVRTLLDASVAKSPVGEFGWDGAACAYTLIDPKNRLSAFFGMQVRGCGYGYDVIHPTLRDMIYDSLNA